MFPKKQLYLYLIKLLNLEPLNPLNLFIMSKIPSFFQKIKNQRWQRIFRFRFKKIVKSIELIVTLVLKLGTLLLVGLLLMFFVRLFQQQGYTLEPFSVPDSLQKSGLNGTIIARQVQDEVVKIKETAHSIKEDSLKLIGNNQPEIDLSVMGVGLSLRTISYHLRDILGYKNQLIQGEIVRIDQQFNLTMRMTDYPPLYYSEDFEEDKEYEAIQRLLRRGGEAILTNTDPYRLAICFFREKKYDESVELIRHIIKERPEEVHWAYIAWGNVLEAQNKYEEATQRFRRATEIKPDFALAYIRLGWTLDRLGKREEAEKMVEKAANLDTKRPERLLDYAWMLHRHQNYEAADSAFRKASVLYSEEPAVWMSWVDSKLSRNDMEGALPIIKKAEPFAEENCRGYLIRAFSSFLQKDTAMTIQHSMTAFDFDPAHPGAIMAGVRATFYSQDYKNTIKVIEKADLSRSNTWQKQFALNLGAMAYNFEKQHDQAFETAHQAIEVDTMRGFPYSTLAETHAFKNEKELFYQNLEKAFQLGMTIQSIDVNEIPYLKFKEEERLVKLLAKYEK